VREVAEKAAEDKARESVQKARRRAARKAAPKPPPSPETKPVASQSEATRSGRAAATAERNNAIVALVRAEPGLTQGEIAERLGLRQETVSDALKNLASSRDGKLRKEAARTESGRPCKRIYAREHDWRRRMRTARKQHPSAGSSRPSARSG
jgi:DNA-binding NarL/FixJ family response regulator